MKRLYEITYQIPPNYFYKSINRQKLNDDLLKKTIPFYCYKIFNKNILHDIKKVLFHKIIAGDLRILLAGDYLCFITSDYFDFYYTSELYIKGILNLWEIKRLHKIFSNYQEEIDYTADEVLYFNRMTNCNYVIEKLKEEKCNNLTLYKIQTINPEL
jgi:hypothetical protein